jgi:hypothetical protein
LTKKFGGKGMDFASVLAVDNNNDLLVAGNIEGTADLDPGASDLQMGKDGFQSLFLSKLNSHGDLRWSRTIQSKHLIAPHSVKTDAAGNCYVLGNFVGVVDFDPSEKVRQLSADGRTPGIFVLKFDREGSLSWAHSYTGQAINSDQSMCVTKDGNIIIGGGFVNGEQLVSDNGMRLAAPLTNEDVFILHLNTDGNVMWTKHFTGAFYNGRMSLAFDVEGNVLMSANYSGTIDVDPSTSVHLLQSATQVNCFLLKLSKAGDFKWAVSLGLGPINESGSIVVADDIFWSGTFTGEVSFGDEALCAKASSQNSCDVFICRVDQAGKIICGGSIKQNDARRPGVLISGGKDMYLSTVPATFSNNVSSTLQLYKVSF